MATSHFRVRLLLIAAASFLAASTLAGCSVIQELIPAQAQRDAETQEIEAEGEQDVFDVAVGDCFNDESDSSTDVYNIPAVPCDQPHDNEIFHLFELTGDTFPADVDALADTGCAENFEAFVGLAYDASVLEYYPIQPTAESWASGDREVICAIYEPEVETAGSLAGVGR